MTSAFTVSFQELIKVKYFPYQGRTQLKNNLVTIPAEESLPWFHTSATSSRYLSVLGDSRLSKFFYFN